MSEELKPRTTIRPGAEPDTHDYGDPVPVPPIPEEEQMSKWRAALESYSRSVAAAAVGAMMVLGHIPLTGADWLLVANALWIGVLPVVARALDSKDTAFGIGSSPTK